MEAEGDFCDELYGDFSQGHSDSPLVYDDNSVDIYSGLDGEKSPNNAASAEISSTLFSPDRLKESMDLYEEFLTEEGKKKEATYNDLKAKLGETQKQVKELLGRLQQVQTQNIALHNENAHLKKNICSLLKTARMEIIRKDEEINRLNQRSVRGGFSHCLPRPMMNISNKRRSYTEPQAPVGTYETRVNCTSRDASQQMHKDNTSSHTDGTLNIENSVIIPSPHNSAGCSVNSLVSSKHAVSTADSCSKDSRSLVPLCREELGLSNKSCLEDDKRQKPPAEPPESRRAKLRYPEEKNKVDKDLNKADQTKDREKPDREPRDSDKESMKYSRRRSQYPERVSELPRRSGRGKSPPFDSSQQATADSHGSKGRVRDGEVQTRNSSRDKRQSQDQERSEKKQHEAGGKEGKTASSSHQNRHRDKLLSSSLSRKGDRSPLREEHRKEERRRDDAKGRRQEASKKHERAKEKQKDKRERSSEVRKDEEKRPSDCSPKSSRHKDVSSSGRHSPVKESRTPVEKTVVDKSVKQREKETQANTVDKLETVVRTCEGEHVKSPEDSRKFKKLSFMETLNLTLSPVKKPKLFTESLEPSNCVTEEGVPESQVEQPSLFELGEKYCVIDEIETSSESLEHAEEVIGFQAEISSSCTATDPIEKPSSTAPLSTGGQCGTPHEKEQVQLNVANIHPECEAGRELDQEVASETAETEVPDEMELEVKSTESEKNPVPSGSDSHTEIRGSDLLLKPPSESVNCDSQSDASVQSLAVDTDHHAWEPQHLKEKTSDSKACDSVAQDTQSLMDASQENCEAQNSVNSESQNSSAVIQTQTVTLDDANSPVTVGAGVQDATLNTEDSNATVSSTVSIEVESQSSFSAAAVSDTGECTAPSCSVAAKEKGKETPDAHLSPQKVQVPDVPRLSSTSAAEMVPADEGSVSSSKLQEPCQSSEETERTSRNLEPDSTKDEKRDLEPSAPEPVSDRLAEIQLCDEDSMMGALKNIPKMPVAISPLTSPVRPAKRSLGPCSPSKAPYVRSQSKELSTVPGIFTLNSKMMEVNKENQKPDCSLLQDPLKDTEDTPPSSSSSDEEELEEGEIVSNSEAEEVSVITSPQQGKQSPEKSRTKLSSPEEPTLPKRKHAKSPPVSKTIPAKKNKTISPTPNGSPSNKRRFRTVLPFLPKTDPSSIHDVMDMLKFIRKQIRKKYMKLQKSFPKKTFYSIIDMSLWEFTDFVNNLNCTKLCSLENNLKSRLCKIISTTLKKISNNGIVNRIFEQQAPNLKKKLWMFVEDQFDFLFKELQTNLVNMCKSSDPEVSSTARRKVEQKRNKEEHQATNSPKLVSKGKEKIAVSESKTQEFKIQSSTMNSMKRGLGSRGKNLKIAMEDEIHKPEEQCSPLIPDKQDSAVVSKHSAAMAPKNVSSTESHCRTVHNSALHDKSDYEILTEQQASSLTFNLVTDSQMGEIFKCLLQGSDLLEHNVPGGDNHNWPISTPRKEPPCGESFVGLATPSKTLTPLKTAALIPWSAMTPEKFLSLSPKTGVPLNPAVLDESCMLEDPSNMLFNKAAPSSTVTLRSYSVLAEDLAVSLTIPSPLKSDSHLSFLHPVNGAAPLAPNSVLRAHYSEDALLDEEDATEQDIHLALDSDNSSSRSEGGSTRQEDPPSFQFKPHLPMQAVVMEKSNDHFIVRIRHTSTGPDQDAPSDENEPLNASENSEVQPGNACPSTAVASCSDAPCPSRDGTDASLTDKTPSELPAPGGSPLGQEVDLRGGNGEHIPGDPAKKLPDPQEDDSAGASEEPPLPDENGGEAGQDCSDDRVAKKRKRRHSAPKAKRAKTDASPERRATPKKRRRSKENVDKARKSPKTKAKERSSLAVSPNSLSAKNVVKKKGEVVVAWTRDDDRTILVELKRKGASEETFSSLSADLNKSPSQIAERFCQLMKLFKKRERMKN
uniref:CASP8-associated protein 2 n=1 Tax=Lepisosteus oculatus TaxID=7918 RepID=W5NJZ3_LEPOC|nr:PREDICTED: CASP8-associated protein 2 isoform X1 [Lepisosteus oculatus]